MCVHRTVHNCCTQYCIKESLTARVCYKSEISVSNPLVWTGSLELISNKLQQTFNYTNSTKTQPRNYLISQLRSVLAVNGVPLMI